MWALISTLSIYTKDSLQYILSLYADKDINLQFKDKIIILVVIIINELVSEYRLQHL